MRGLEDDDNKRSPKGPPASARILLILVLSVVLMVFDHGSRTLSPVRSSLATVTQPLQAIAQLPQTALTSLWALVDRDDLRGQKRILERRLLLLEGKLQKLAALQAENERIRGLLSSAESLEEEVLIAQILAVSPEPYRHLLKLNKGSLDGVFVGQALIDGNGIIGQVIQVSPLGATAITITDSNHGIPVEFNRTGLQTIAHGTGQSGLLVLPFLPSNADIRVGDLLVSSGLGGIYPPGYPVARVTDIAHPPGSQFLTVTADPTASLNRGREVLLVWREPIEAGAGLPASAQAGHGAAPAKDITAAAQPPQQ